MIPIAQREAVERRAWITEAELMDAYAVGQSLPGIIAVNTSIQIGNRIRGIIGGIVAGLAVAFPSLVVIIVIAAFLKNFTSYPVVEHAFAGVRVCVLVLIINTIKKLFKTAAPDIVSIILCSLVFLLSITLSISPVIYVVLCAAAGIAVMSIEGRSRRGGS